MIFSIESALTAEKTALWRNPLLQMVAQPKAFHSLLFSRYEASMLYGTQVDNALMGNQEKLQSDISLILFLNNPSTYGGGELVIESIEAERTFKLEAELGSELCP